jgi:Mrr restriction endonuclease-like protein
MATRFSPPLELPTQSKVERELLRLLSGRSRPTETQHVYRELAAVLGLSPAQQHGSRPNAKGSAWEYLVRQAARHLQDEGNLCRPGKAQWTLTPQGKKRSTQTAEDLGL